MSARAAPQSVLIFVVLVPRMHSSKYGIQFVHVCNLISNNLSSYSHLASKKRIFLCEYRHTDISLHTFHSYIQNRTVVQWWVGWDTNGRHTDGRTNIQPGRQTVS